MYILPQSIDHHGPSRVSYIFKLRQGRVNFEKDNLLQPDKNAIKYPLSNSALFCVLLSNLSSKTTLK